MQMPPVIVRDDRLYLTARFSVSFQAARLPPTGIDEVNRSVGMLPVCRSRDFAGVPDAWKMVDSAFVPLDDEFTFWLGLWTERGGPHALKVRADELNAVSGQGWDGAELRANPQNYVVCPPQWSIDGLHHSDGTIRHFSPMRGLGVRHPPIGLTVFRPRKGVRTAKAAPQRGPTVLHDASTPADPRGFMRGVVPDPLGPGLWDADALRRVGIYIVSGAEYERLTRRPRPRFSPHDRPIPRLP